MIRFRHLFCASVLAMQILPVHAAAAAPEHPAAQTAEQSVGARLLRATNEMWFLLSGVVDKTTADAAAARFDELVEESCRMSDKLFDADSQALDLDALDKDTYRIAEAYEDLSYEFESLCRARCYGSAALISAFVKAMHLGVFSDDSAEYLQSSSLQLTEQAATAEIQRLERLAPQDQALLLILTGVRDARSANLAAEQLKTLTKDIRKLFPVYRLRSFNFPEKRRAELALACSKLEPILWKIRNEIVRIVSLPGYDDDAFDTFSDALDSAFECLGETHAACFDDVFDDSFRSDLDDALHDSVTSSQP